MDWLGGWLKSIVAVILVATFVDLLLPSSTMQRYVKTVMSLIILLTLISPVLQLFEKKFNIEQMLSAAEHRQEQQSLLASGENGSARMKSLEAIVQDASKLKAAGQKQSQQLLQARIAELMKQDLQQQTELRVETVQVTANLDNNGNPAISQVRVTLHEIEKSEEKQPEEKRSIAVMEPVKPVERVQIDPGWKKPVQAAAPESGKLTPVLEQEIARLAQGISRDWRVDREHIDIRLHNEQGKI